MAHTKKPQKAQTTTKRSNLFSEEFTLGLGRLKDFYNVVSVLNNELGHGNWTTRGRPVRKVKRVDIYNRHCYKLTPIGLRTIDIVFCVPSNAESIQSRLVLELS